MYLTIPGANFKLLNIDRASLAQIPYASTLFQMYQTQG